MYTAIALLSLAISLASTSPITTSPKPAHVLAKRTNQCGDSSFDPVNTSGAFYSGAAISDCDQLVANIQGDGSWGIDPTLYFQQLVSYGSCSFWATSANGVAPTVGNQDIIDLVGSVKAMHSFAVDGDTDPVIMFGTGTMPCQAQGGDASEPAQVQWLVGKMVF